MEQHKPLPDRVRTPGKLPHRFRELLDTLLSHAVGQESGAAMLREICPSLLGFSGGDALLIRVAEEGKTKRCYAVRSATDSGVIDSRFLATADAARLSDEYGLSISEPVLQAILAGRVAAPGESCTRSGSFVIGDTARPILLRDEAGRGANRTVVIGGRFQSLALVPFRQGEGTLGMLLFASRRRDFFSIEDVQIYEAVAQTLAVAMAHKGVQHALRERVKELTCLYEIERLAERRGIGPAALLDAVVALLPPAWQFPDITSARIVFDDREFGTRAPAEPVHRQAAPILVNEITRGFVEVAYGADAPAADEGPFLREERNLIEAVADTIGRFVSQHEAEWALRERVKELTCLYGIAKVADRPGISLERFLEEIIELLPAGWQYPELAAARITLDGRSFATARFRDSQCRQTAEIRVDGALRGNVEVAYVEDVPRGNGATFLKEEQSLIHEIARQVGLTVEHWEVESEKARLKEQLLHAERLATVGQLSAGVAHELNEPLGAILGFAELVRQAPQLHSAAARDVDRIIKAALHAREIIRKLMIFTRQVPPRKARCDLNHIVSEDVYFLESRCTKEGIALVRDLEDGLPDVMIDASQIHQVLVNLMVNAIQAMPGGGRLTVRTRSGQGMVSLFVSDTGVGMSPDVRRRLFTPFFTTKDVGQGTGLGLAVVHGIVTGHGGTLQVESEEGKGSTFHVSLPIGSPAGSQENG